MIKIAKFGGTSLASAEQFMKVREILLSDDDRCLVVPSAPGKRDDGDIKITDMLIACHKLAEAGGDFSEALDEVGARFDEIKNILDIDEDISSDIETIYEDMKAGAGEDICEIPRRVSVWKAFWRHISDGSL